MIGIAITPSGGDGVQDAIHLLGLGLQDQPATEFAYGGEDATIVPIEEAYVGPPNLCTMRTGLAQPGSGGVRPDEGLIPIKETPGLFDVISGGGTGGRDRA